MLIRLNRWLLLPLGRLINFKVISIYNFWSEIWVTWWPAKRKQLAPGFVSCPSSASFILTQQSSPCLYLNCPLETSNQCHLSLELAGTAVISVITWYSKKQLWSLASRCWQSTWRKWSLMLSTWQFLSQLDWTKGSLHHLEYHWVLYKCDSI